MPPKGKITRKTATRQCYIKSCSNKAAIWIERHEGDPDLGTRVEAKVCVTHAYGQKQAKNQDG